MTDPGRLIAGYLDDVLTPEQHAELTAWLKAHPDHLRSFVEANVFDQQVRGAVAGAAQRESANAFVPAGTAAAPPQERGAAEHWLPDFGRLRPRWVLAAAAALLLALAGMSWWSRNPSVAPSPGFARVTRALSAEVSGQTGGVQAGQALGPGRVTLAAGAVEIALNNGVTMVFEGPGDLELLNPMRALLHGGQAVVRVPASAIGFQLETPGAQVVDLGTEFGVKAGPGMSTDVQVYEGVVITTPKPATTAGSFPQRLTAGNAARFTLDAHRAPQVLAYAPERFVRRLPADKPIEQEERLSPMFNPTRFEEALIPPPERSIVVDGDLSEWSDAGSFRAERSGPDAKGHFIAGRMRYDAEFLYIAAHIGDPAPMRSVIDPATDGEFGWRGGGLQVRLSTDPALGWPVDANAPNYYQMRRIQPDPDRLANATSEQLAHLTMWHHAPGARNCLHIAHGMDFHGGMVNPAGYRAAFRKDADGRGYTLEYAIPWAVLKAPRPPRPGETLAMSWTVHWSDEGGRLWRGQLVELRNASEPVRIHTWERAATWGRAVFR
jgi:hypothetical protein